MQDGKHFPKRQVAKIHINITLTFMLFHSTALLIPQPQQRRESTSALILWASSTQLTLLVWLFHKYFPLPHLIPPLLCKTVSVWHLSAFHWFLPCCHSTILYCQSSYHIQSSLLIDTFVIDILLYRQKSLKIFGRTISLQAGVMYFSVVFFTKFCFIG